MSFFGCPRRRPQWSSVASFLMLTQGPSPGVPSSTAAPFSFSRISLRFFIFSLLVFFCRIAESPLLTQSAMATRSHGGRERRRPHAPDRQVAMPGTREEVREILVSIPVLRHRESGFQEAVELHCQQISGEGSTSVTPTVVSPSDVGTHLQGIRVSGSPRDGRDDEQPGPSTPRAPPAINKAPRVRTSRPWSTLLRVPIDEEDIPVAFTHTTATSQIPQQLKNKPTKLTSASISAVLETTIASKRQENTEINPDVATSGTTTSPRTYRNPLRAPPSFSPTPESAQHTQMEDADDMTPITAKSPYFKRRAVAIAEETPWPPSMTTMDALPREQMALRHARNYAADHIDEYREGLQQRLEELESSGDSVSWDDLDLCFQKVVWEAQKVRARLKHMAEKSSDRPGLDLNMGLWDS